MLFLAISLASISVPTSSNGDNDPVERAAVAHYLESNLEKIWNRFKGGSTTKPVSESRAGRKAPCLARVGNPRREGQPASHP